MRRPDRTTQAIDLHLPKALLITSFASSNADETLVARMFSYPINFRQRRVCPTDRGVPKCGVVRDPDFVAAKGLLFGMHMNSPNAPLRTWGLGGDRKGANH